jgi:fluoride ion exporter CrcB/FEX
MLTRPLTFPWGTFIVNVSGSFLLGFLTPASSIAWSSIPDLRITLTVGSLGAYNPLEVAIETFEFVGTKGCGLTVEGEILAVWLGRARRTFLVATVG